MAGRIREYAPAKLNLTLDVLYRRDDGYHELESVMQSVSLCDVVDISISGEKGIEVDISREDLPKGLHNLAGKAVEKFLDYVNRRDLGVMVYITKNIPDKAGLAGGSSDAAAVIRGLDRLLGTGLSEKELLELCAGVGSDVPFCLRGGTMLCRGRGDRLSELPAIGECGILIVKPSFSVSTPELFAELDRRAVNVRPDNAAVVRALECGDLEAVCRGFVNVFEDVLPERERQTVEEIKGAMRAAGALGCAMTGTGSAVFGVFRSKEEALRADLGRFGDTFVAEPVKVFQVSV